MHTCRIITVNSDSNKAHHKSDLSQDLNIKFLDQIKLVNINASDVVDGKSAVVLGLIWTIILYFQVLVTSNKLLIPQLTNYLLTASMQ